jgi:hypothetical protein
MKKILAIATAAMIACGSANAASIVDGDLGAVAGAPGNFQPADSNQIPGWVESEDRFVPVQAGAMIASAASAPASDPFYGLALVPASIAAIPEPTTWMMLLGGLGLVGFAMRGRKRQVTTFA